MLCGLTVFDIIKIRYRNWVFCIAGIILFIIAGFRPANVDRDYGSYLEFFKQEFTFGKSILEPSFILISIIVHKFLFAKPLFIFVIYALIAISLKLGAIKHLSDFKFTSLLLYFSYSFTIQDMTQIRVGVATAFLLLCVMPLYERNLWKFLLFTGLAICFHYSALVILPLWFFNPKKINSWIYGIFIFFAYLMYFLSGLYVTNFANYLPSGPILAKVLAYEYDNNGLFNVFNTWQLVRCFLCFIFLWKIDIIEKRNQYAILLVKIYVLATCIYVILAYNPVFASRVSDIFSIVDIIILPCLMYLIKPKYGSLIFLIFLSFFYLSLNLFYNKIIF